LLLGSKRKKIHFVDFDTIFSSYFQSKRTLNYEIGEFSDIRVVLPHIKNIESVIKDTIVSLSCDSILILDSLNGLIDSLNMLNRYKIKSMITDKKKKSLHRSAGYQSLNILLLLLKKIEDKEIPIVIMIYQPLEKSKKMVNDLLVNGDLEIKNHFLRISNNVLFLDFNEDDNRTGFTVIKNKSSVFPSSTLMNTRSMGFSPYSRWFYYSFVKL
jgi:hypothetical protein